MNKMCDFMFKANENKNCLHTIHPQNQILIQNNCHDLLKNVFKTIQYVRKKNVKLFLSLSFFNVLFSYFMGVIWYQRMNFCEIKKNKHIK